MGTLLEKINPEKYNRQIEALYGTLKYMLADNIEVNKVVEVFRTPGTGEIQWMEVRAKANINNRLKWKRGKEDKIVGVLSCEELIEMNEDGDYRHRYFSFHFEAEESSNVKTFRVDYKPDKPIPLHAHADNYSQTHLHLKFPDDTSLDLPHIDFCTIMIVISYYIKHEEKYPLFSGEDYNPRMMKRRRRYDEYGKG